VYTRNYAQVHKILKKKIESVFWSHSPSGCLCTHECLERSY